MPEVLPTASFGEAALLWSVRASLALLTAGFVLRHRGRERLARGCWAGGAGLMWVHVLAAFGVRHGWSHAAAVADTARQTEALTGWDWGGGVWVNHLFAAVWSADAAWRLAAPASYRRRPRAVDYGVGGFLGFIAVNGAVVFAHGPTRWAGVAACGLLIVTAALGRRRAAPAD